MFFFSKMQASGNDFIIINNIENKFEYSFKLLSKFLCNRHFGVGADGVLIVDNGKKTKYKMRIFNQDGSEAEMCGNGIRCFAKYLYDTGMIDKKEFNIETLDGIKYVNLNVEGNTVIDVEVDMGNPILDFKEIPVYYDNISKHTYLDKKNTNIEIENFEVYPISMGNPHCVIFVENVDKIDIEKIGKIIENYKYFPNKTNVEFVEIQDKNNIKVRVWERGVGETLACGTGACSSAVVSYLYKSTNSDITVNLRGGKLNVKYNNNKVYLKGNAEMIFEGKMNI